MFELIDFSKYDSTLLGYGGQSGKKRNIIIDGKQYMVKFPDNLKARGLKNVVLSYSNGPIGEFLGSQIYKAAGIPVHDTVLGIMDKKIVVACRHIYDDGERLVGFNEIRNVLDEGTSGESVVLDDVLNSLRSLQDVVPFDVTSRFWDMFMMDAFINNPDRNNGNWGLIYQNIGGRPVPVRIADVFDNGASFNPRWDEAKFSKCLGNDNDLKAMSNAGVVSIFTRRDDSGEFKRINPFKYMESMSDSDCSAAVMRIVPRINMEHAHNLIDFMAQTGLIGSAQADFYDNVLEMRMSERLMPLYDALRSNMAEQSHHRP